MSEELPGIRADQFPLITSRQWWVYFELTEPKPAAALCASSGLVENSIQRHLNALLKMRVIHKSTAPSSAEAVYTQGVGLTAKQEVAARKMIASANLTSPDHWSVVRVASEEASLTPAVAVPSPLSFRERHADHFGAALFGVSLVVSLAFAGLVASTADGFGGGVVLFILIFLVGGLIITVVIVGGIGTLVESPEQKAAHAKYVQSQPQKPDTSGRTPLRNWRGILSMTKAATVEAYCARCRRTWRLDGRTANTVAETQGLSNRLIRGGTKMEQFGATFTVGASGRRIAAGNESERHSRNLALTLALAACPTCRAIDEVYLKA